ncbi:MAG: SDR family oxidoreductase [Caldilineaceae bacterium]
MSAFDPQSIFDLSGRVALVTGPGRGIGRAMTTALAAAGADIAVIYRNTIDEIQADVEGMGRRFVAIQIDLAEADQPQLAAAVQEAAAKLGRLDVVVNNAGTIRRGPAMDFSVEDWRTVLNVNLDAPFWISQAAGRIMQEQPLENGTRGKIIQVASLLSHQGGILVPAYTAAKHALAGVTKALANEWAQHAINVNAIAPGYMITDNTQALWQDPARRQAILERIPAGRWGEPADLAGITLFLASSASNYVHGAIIPVDGGWLGR